ncbi:MAG: tRNA pseudouridine(13) synthase TruD [bacterium]
MEDFLTILAKQKSFLDKLQKEQPSLFTIEQILDEETTLKNIGITTLSNNRPDGYIKLYPQDFIVEEVRQNGTISVIEPKDDFPLAQDGKKTLYCNLVKANVSTIDAIARLAKALNLAPEKIGYAGIKDNQAITSQLIALPNINAGQITRLKTESFFLTNFYYGTGSLNVADLTGNSFTILVRTKEKIDQEHLKREFKKIKDNGFLNFYQTQRFGTPRLIGHHLGKMILQGNYEHAIKAFLLYSSIHDLKLVRMIRTEAQQLYGYWDKMKKVFASMPVTFQHELKILSHLEQHPQDFIGALHAVKDQSTLWIYAYPSYLFNLLLSENQNNLPPELPLLLNDNEKDIALYQNYLTRDGITNFAKALKPFKFIQLKRRLTPTRVYPKNIMFMSTDEGVICHFDLDKGSYATSFLMNLFKLSNGLPYPAWTKKTPCDIKKYLQLGTNAEVVKRLGDYIKREQV